MLGRCKGPSREKFHKFYKGGLTMATKKKATKKAAKKKKR
jgi:hypothetical protein